MDQVDQELLLRLPAVLVFQDLIQVLEELHPQEVEKDQHQHQVLLTLEALVVLAEVPVEVLLG